MNNDLILLKDVPNLEEDYEVSSVDLACEYWSPEDEGEKRRLLFWGVELRKAPDHDTPERDIELPCAVFIEPSSGETHKTVINGSKRLVAAFENNAIERGTPVQITYQGKKKNSTNANLSDQWSIVTLAKKGKSE